jgi:DNA recombination protein RmuC
MDLIVYLVIGLVIGFLLGWFINKSLTAKHAVDKSRFDEVQNELNRLEVEKNTMERSYNQAMEDADSSKKEYKELQEQKEAQSNKLSSLETKLENYTTHYEELKKEKQEQKEELSAKIEESQKLKEALAHWQTQSKAYQKENTELHEKANAYEKELKALNDRLIQTKSQLTEESERNKNLKEKLETQKKELEEIGKKFSTEFKNLANEIFEDKSKKFTQLNHERIKEILTPLGKNIDEFKKKVDETHKKDIADRASIQERIKNLVESSNKISEEANNLTKALKGSAKKQGDWGEMILENILESSGLSKGREYFVQEFLKDESGAFYKDDAGKKLQPDVIIKYPDDRKVIIDSKVSLLAYEKFTAADDHGVQQKELENHILSVRQHIQNLSSKNYQDFAATLDFVFLFIPIEPAYMLAIQNDPGLWEFAYNKRIILISPTNLIAALKLIADLWKREYQNQNAMDIAERGGRLYDKFVTFVGSLSDIGTNLDRSQKSYQDAMKQLKTGNGSLISQVERLKKLGVKASKSIPQQIINESDEGIEQ